MSKLDLGKIGIWQANFDRHPTADVKHAVGELEAMGWKCIWSPEAIGRDVMIASSLILESSENLFAATGIAQTYARHPMTTAASQKSLAEAHGNRFVLGLGVSHGPIIEGMRGLKYEKPLTHMKNYLAQMQDATYLAVPPDSPPPTLLAALGPKMLELAATEAGGAHPYNVIPSHTAKAREIMGKDAFLAPEQKVIFETDPERARTAARAAISLYMELPNYINNFKRMGFSEEDIESMSDKFIDGLFAWGDIDAIKKRLDEHLDAGADHVAVQVIGASTSSQDGAYDPKAKPRPLPMSEWAELAEQYF